VRTDRSLSAWLWEVFSACLLIGYFYTRSALKSITNLSSFPRFRLSTFTI